MQILFILALLIGLILGVSGMLLGVDRKQVRRRAPVFNLPTVAAGLALFGALGYLLLRYTTLATPAVLGISGGAGLAGAIGMYALIAGWALPSARREVEDERFLLQGFPARVTRAIRPGGEGEIVYEHNGERLVAVARGVDGRAAEAGIEVVIERMEHGVAYVELWSTIERELQLPS
jgi:hypothetical protein